MKKIYSIITVFILGISAFSLKSDAIDFTPDLLSADVSHFLDDGDKCAGCIEDTSPRESIMRIVNYFLTFLGLIASLMFIYAGVRLIIGAGDEDSVTNMKNILIYSIVGIMLVLLSFTIVRWIFGAVGV